MRGPIDRLVARSLTDEQSYVTNPARAQHLWHLGLLSLALVLAATSVRLWGAHLSWLDLPAALVLGGYAGAAAMGRPRRAMAYRNGWLDGRRTMLATLVESTDRGMSLGEWVEGECERDAHLLYAPQGADECDGGTS